MTFAASTRHDGEVSFMDVCERSVQHRLETCIHVHKRTEKFGCGKNSVPFVNVYIRLSIPPRMGGAERARVRNPWA